MVDVSVYLVFLAAALVICVIPGTDMIYIVTSAISQGVRAGLLASVGMSVGMLVHSAAVVLGLASLVATSPTAYGILRYAGAVYLAYLGIRTLIGARNGVDATIASPLRQRSSTIFRRAVVTNVLNPKIIVFYLAFLPQFVRPDQANSVVQLLVLSLSFVALGLVVDSVVAVASGRIGEWLRNGRRSVKWLDRIAGVVFIGLAVTVAVG